MYCQAIRFLVGPHAKMRLEILHVDVVVNLRRRDISGVIMIRILALEADLHLLIDRLIEFVVVVGHVHGNLEVIQNITVNLHRNTHLEIVMTYNFDREGWLIS